MEAYRIANEVLERVRVSRVLLRSADDVQWVVGRSAWVKVRFEVGLDALLVVLVVVPDYPESRSRLTVHEC